jgi:transcriptional regulator with XRE-family HTH domain
MEDLYHDFGRRLREARKRAHLSQDAVAKLVGLSRTSITNIERGNQPVQLHILYRLASVVAVDPATLLPPVDEANGDSPIASQLLRGLKGPEREWARRVVQKGKS